MPTIMTLIRNLFGMEEHFNNINSNRHMNLVLEMMTPNEIKSE